MRSATQQHRPSRALLTGLCLGVVAICAVLAALALLNASRRPSAANAPGSGAASLQPRPGGTEGVASAAPGNRGPAATAPSRSAHKAANQPRQLTEELFIEISAVMVRSAEAFSDSEKGRQAYEQACEGILRQHGVSREAFEKMEAEILSDPQRHARVVDLIEAKVQELSRPKNIRVTTDSEPRPPSRHSPTSR